MFKTAYRLGLGVLAVTLVTAGVQAQTLKERKAQQQQSAALESEVAYTNKICGSAISAEVDWSRYAGPVGDATSSCDAALSALESLCADQLSQEEIQQRVDQVVCTKGKDRQVSLKKGTLTFQMDGPGMDDFRYIRDYLTSAFEGGDN